MVYKVLDRNRTTIKQLRSIVVFNLSMLNPIFFLRSLTITPTISTAYKVACDTADAVKWYRIEYGVNTYILTIHSNISLNNLVFLLDLSHTKID